MKAAYSLFLFVILVFTISCSQSSKQQKVTLTEHNPTILQKEGNKVFQYWEIENQDYWQGQQLGDVEALWAYRDSLSQVLGNSVLSVTLEKRREEVSRENNELPKDSLSNKELIKQGYVGTIRDINYLEAEVLNYQINRYPMLSRPTEFHSFIAENDSLGRIRIYFGASDQPFPPKPKAIISHLEKTFAEGWRLTHHLHNHYEPKSNNYLGIMAPSLADAQYYKFLKQDFGLGKALITNGFATVVLDSANFEKFNSH